MQSLEIITIEQYRENVKHLQDIRGHSAKSLSRLGRNIILHTRDTRCSQVKRRQTSQHATVAQIESPISNDDDKTHSGHEALAKGPLSGLVPGSGSGGESTATTATTPESSSSQSSGGLFGGLPGVPSGIPGASYLGGGEGGGGQSPTLILGGFSIMLVPMRGMSLSNIGSMLSTGQQLGQMLPKPGGS